jgi:aminoglycoside/choline kinase family phosphotransferase
MADSEPLAAKDRDVAARIVERTLARRWPGARIRSLEGIAGDASSRRYVRCWLDATRVQDADAPDRLVVMLMQDASVALSSEELSVFGEDGPEEIPFINVARFLSARSDAVPTQYEIADDATAFVLEDDGDKPLWDAASAPGTDPEPLFGAALDLLASLQVRCTDDGSGCYAFGQAFDERLFRWELDHFLEYGVVDRQSEAARASRGELAELARRLAKQRRVFCHRDYHAWNIYVQEGRLRIIDFQDALLAPRLYDVASLLTDRCTPDLITPERETRLLERYRGALAVNDTAAAIDGEYRCCVLQRSLKVIGRFNYLADVKGKPRYARMLPWVAATARRTARALPELTATNALLDDQLRDGAPR